MTLTGRIARKALPKPTADRLAFTLNTYKNYRKLRSDLAALRRQASACQSLEEQVELVRHHKTFGAIQQPGEIVGLLKLLQQNPPRYVCEIGSASGGTLFLFAQVCRPDALFISIDLDLSMERALVHARMVRAQQRIVCVRGNSRDPKILERVRSLLRGRALDFLFIDGDHSYDGVKADFMQYRPLVRPDGLIALHDIVPDFQTRYGTPTPSYTGGVPVFWQELKARHQTSEFIEDPEQDGYGIGIVHN